MLPAPDPRVMPGIAPVGDDVSGHLGGVARNGTLRAVPHGIMPERYGIVGGRPIDAHWHFGTT